MKKLLFIAACVAALSSCSQNEIQGPENGVGKPIGFDKYVGSAPSKGLDVTTDNLKTSGFYVTAQKSDGTGQFFPCTLFEWDGTTGIEDYRTDPLYYWPTYDLDFFACNLKSGATPTNQITDVTYTAGVPESFTYTTTNAGATQEDVVIAYLFDQNVTGGAEKDLTFYHMLSKISTEVLADNKVSNYELKVLGIKYLNVNTFGKCNYDDADPETSTWSDQATAVEMDLLLKASMADGAELTGAATPTAKAAHEDSEALIVIPQDLDEVSIKYQWYLDGNKYGDEETKVINISSIKPKTNEHYTITYTFALGQPITFQATVEGWGDTGKTGSFDVE